MTVTCEACGKTFEARRSTAKFCGATCRKRKERGNAAPARKAAEARPPVRLVASEGLPAQVAGQPVVEAVRKELEAADRLDTALGQQAVRLAERLHSEYDTGSAVASVSRELRAVMAEALKDAGAAADPVDELAQRRQRKAAGG